MPLEGINNIHGGHSLPSGVFSVSHGVTNDVFQEDLENASGFFINEPTDSLHSASPGQSSDRRLGDPLDVIPQNFGFET